MQEAEHAALARAHAEQGGRGPLMLGSQRAAALYEAVAAPPGQRRCGLPSCGLRGDRLQKCTRCKSACYCCKAHQVEHWPQHRPECKRIAREAAAALAATSERGKGATSATSAAAAPAAAQQPASGSAGAAAAAGASGSGGGSGGEVVSWRQLERLGPGQAAEGKVLELRVLSQPAASFRHLFQGMG